MSATALTPTPVVLIVEDNRRALDLRLEAFSDAGFTAIGAQSVDAAMREMRSGPAVDVVVTDIRLDDSKPEDKSGVDLARHIKANYRDMPVAGYSAVFGDSDVEGDRDVFDSVWPKGSNVIAQIDEIIAKCLDYALVTRKDRHETAFVVHDRLLRRHEQTYPDIELMRELSPGGDPAAARNDSALGEAGYRLKLVEAKGNGLAQPVIVWLLDTGDGIDAEVYGQPALYAHGATDTLAIASVVELMRLYAAEIGPDSMEAVGPALSLTEFLRDRLHATDD